MRRLLPLMLLLAASLCAESLAADPTLVIESGGHARFIKMISFTSDSKQVVSVGDDGAIRVWDADKRRLVKVINCCAGGGRVRIKAAALSLDNMRVAIAGDFNSEAEGRYAVRVYELESGKLLSLLKHHTDAVTALAFSPDGRYLASGSGFNDKSILVWDVTTGIPVELPEVHTDVVTCLAFSPDGKLLASGSDDTTVKLWDWANKTEARQLRKLHTDEVKAVAFSPDGRYLASGGMDKRIFLWDMKDNGARTIGTLLSSVPGIFSKILGGAGAFATLTNGILDIDFSPDGKQLMAGAKRGDCNVFAVPSGKDLRPCTREDTVTAVAFSPDSKLLATNGGFNGELYVEKLDEKPCVGNENHKHCRSLAGHGQTVWSVGFARDGKSIAFGNNRVDERPGRYGPLEQVFNLKQDGGYRLSLGGAPGAESDFIRSVDKSGDYS